MTLLKSKTSVPSRTQIDCAFALHSLSRSMFSFFVIRSVLGRFYLVRREGDWLREKEREGRATGDESRGERKKC